MRRKFGLAAGAVAFLAAAAGAWAAVSQLQAKPGEFDPKQTHLVQGTWLPGIGCPRNATTATVNSSGQIVTGPAYTDPACATGDTRDGLVRGLLLAKTGPTTNVASAFARITGVRGSTLTELGYDLRKPDSAGDPRGSHCGAGAPRFNVVTSDGTRYFVGCNSPPATTQTAGNGWIRLRWGGGSPLLAYSTAGVLTDITGMTVRSISIVFDEGQDTGPDNFGLAVLDNVDVNGRLVGRGPVSAS